VRGHAHHDDVGTIGGLGESQWWARSVSLSNDVVSEGSECCGCCPLMSLAGLVGGAPTAASVLGRAQMDANRGFPRNRLQGTTTLVFRASRLPMGVQRIGRNLTFSSSSRRSSARGVWASVGGPRLSVSTWRAVRRWGCRHSHAEFHKQAMTTFASDQKPGATNGLSYRGAAWDSS